MPTVSPAATLCYIVKHPWFVPNWSHHNTLCTNQLHTHTHTHTHIHIHPHYNLLTPAGVDALQVSGLWNYKTPTPAKTKLHITNVRFIAFFSRWCEALQQSHKSLPLANALHIHTRPNPPPSHRHALKTHATGTYLPNNVQTDVPTVAALAVSRSLRSYSIQFLAHACRWEYLPQQQQLFSAPGEKLPVRLMEKKGCYEEGEIRKSWLSMSFNPRTCIAHYSAP